MSIEIRRAVEMDYAAIAEISREDLGYDCVPELVKKQLCHALSKPDEAVFVAVCNDIVAGYVHAEDYDVLYFPTMKNIMGLAVSEKYRRLGLGSKLLAAVESWAKETGAAGVRLNSGMTRKGAHVFYRKNGYTNEKEQMRFEKVLE